MKAKRYVVSFLLGIAVTSFQALAGTATPSSILVIPARARMVQFAFQVAAVKDVGIVSYGNGVDTAEILVHVWNGHEWIRISAEEYASGAFMAGTTDDVYLLGPANNIPPFMNSDPVWGRNIRRIATLDIASILNEIGKTLKLTPRQWKWLAEKNNLTLTDTNSERRRYGRWGRSGIDSSVRRPASAPVDAVIMPPVAPATEKAPELPEPAPAPMAPAVAPAPAAPAVTPPPAVIPPPATATTPQAPPVAPDPTTK